MGKRALILGGALLALGLGATVLIGAWRSWLAASALAISLPAGAIGWILVMRLAVGAWTGPIAEACAAIAGRAPFASLTLLPVLVAQSAIYPWAGAHQATAFRAAYFNPAVFDLRALAWLAVLSLAGLFIASGREVSKPAACIGVIAFFLFQTMFVTDALASLDLTFNASGFGLYVMAIQFGAALAMAILAGRPEETHRAGALLLALMMMWGYFAFMQYFILWSGNLPAGMSWFHARSQGLWPGLMALIAGCRLPLPCLLIFPPVRHSRRWMMTLAAVVLAGDIMEVAWIALPGAGYGPLQGGLYAVMALAALALAWPLKRAIPDEGGSA